VNFGSNPENPGFPEAKTEGFGVAGGFLPRTFIYGVVADVTIIGMKFSSSRSKA